MQHTRKLDCPLVAALVGLVALVVCGSSLGSPGMRRAVPCTKTAIVRAVTAAGKAQGTAATLIPNSFGCAAGWAYANANMGPAKHAVTVTLVFRSNGTAWALQNRAKVCKAPGNKVPSAIYKKACAAS